MRSHWFFEFNQPMRDILLHKKWWSNKQSRYGKLTRYVNDPPAIFAHTCSIGIHRGSVIWIGSCCSSCCSPIMGSKGAHIISIGVRTWLVTLLSSIWIVIQWSWPRSSNCCHSTTYGNIIDWPCPWRSWSVPTRIAKFFINFASRNIIFDILFS